MSITAKIGNTNNIVGSVSQGNKVQVTRVQLPASTRITQLTDVDLSDVQQGSCLLYTSPSPRDS